MSNPLQLSPDHPIAYFCAEYGLDANLPIYAGGLGILAGDTIKAAADADVPFTAVGLLYRGEEARQNISLEGEQTEDDIPVDPLSLGLEHVDVDGQPLFIKVHLTQVTVWMHCWKKQIGPNQTLYLLDTETEQNHLNERMITHPLYTGTEESQLKQQILLGVGGVKLLHSLNIHPSVYHVNEGRPAFLHWQLIRIFMDNHGMTFEEAKEAAKHQTVYTNHTLVKAGNPSFNVDLVKTFGEYYANKMGVEVERLVFDGLEDDPTRFRLTRFALNISRKASGVSALHTEISKSQWPDYDWVNITNGVHLGSWQSPIVAQASATQDAGQLWKAHLQEKQNLSDFVKSRTGFGFDPNKLVVGWARRLAGYKQFDQLFVDVQDLKKVLSNQDRPVQLLLSGKAHFQDNEGKALLKQVIGYLQHELAGHALFIPNYDIEVGKHLTRGCDVWLNTPVVGMEACGTSGMKAVSNGVLQCTTKDGWVPEVEWYGKGWILDEEHTGESFYWTLENHIAPLFYDQDANHIPQKWVEMMRASMSLAGQYSARRMLEEYQKLLYATQ